MMASMEKDNISSYQDTLSVMNSFIQKSDDIYYNLDGNGNIIFINEAINNLGYSSADLIGKHIMEIVHPYDRSAAEYRINERRTGDRKTLAFETRLIPKLRNSGQNGTSNTPVYIFEAEGIYTSGKLSGDTFKGTRGIGRHVTKFKRTADESSKNIAWYKKHYKKLEEKKWNKIDSAPENITEKEAGMDINPLKDEYDNILKIIPGAVLSAFIIDTNSSSFILKKWEEWTGIISKDIKKDYSKLTDCIHPEDFPRIVEKYKNAVEKIQEYNFEYRLVHKNSGEIRTVRENGIPVFDEMKILKRFDGIVIDATRNKRVDNALENERGILKYLIDNLPDPVYVKDTFGRYILYNKSFVNNSSVRNEFEILGKTDFNLLPEKTAKQIQENESKILNAGKIQKYNEEARKNNDKWISTTKVPFKNIEGVIAGLIGIDQDVTSLKNTEIALQKSHIELEKRVKERTADLEKSNRILAEAQHIAHLGNWEWDIKTDKLHWSDEIYTIFGVEQKNIDPTYDLFLSIIHPDDRDLVEQSVNEAISKNTDYSIDHRIILKNGLEKYVHEDVKVVLDKNAGKPVKMIGTVLDISDRKKAEQALYNSELRYRTVSDFTYDWEYWVDQNEKLQYVSPSCERITGYKADEFYENQNLFEKIIFSEDKQILVKHNHDSHKELKLRLVQLRIIRKDGEICWIEHACRPVIDNNGNFLGIRASNRDITARKNAEEEKSKLETQLFHAQKMDSIGRLTGGIAHDFNNILCGILGYAEILKTKIEDNRSFESKALNIIHNGALKATKLTKQLLSFARKEEYETFPLNVNIVMKESVLLVEKTFEENINLIYDLDKDINLVDASESQLDQVFTNLIINAKDSMPDGGDLTLKTENVFLDKTDTNFIPYLTSGNYAVITISDTGTGMASEVIDKIFEPFYTTKKKGKGTGLGLSTVYRIIKNHKGHISVYSEVDKGTVFKIYLPVSGANVINEESKKDSESLIKGNEKILLVDDDLSILEIMKIQLEELGYTAITVDNGTDAVKYFEDKKENIDLILLDLIIPGISGKKTFSRIKELKPDAKIIVLSGFSKNKKVSKMIEKGAADFIQKPFKLYDFSNTIRKVLDK